MRSKCNLAPPKPPAPVIMSAEERRQYLGMVALWRIFDLYLEG